MAATQADLALRVLSKLRIVGTGQPGYPEDVEKAKQALRAAHASFRKDGRVRWQISQMPESAEEPYVLMASYLVADDFGKVAKPEWLQYAEREITAIVRTANSQEPVRVEYF